MIERIIRASVRHRLLVWIVTGIVVAGGWWSVRTIAIDAIPDLSDVQVIVLTDYPGQAPQVVEDQVTYPLTTALLAVPHARGWCAPTAFFGFSHRLRDLRGRHRPLLGALSGCSRSLNYAQWPPAARGVTATDSARTPPGVGWVYQYALSDFGPRARQLRARLDVDGSGELDDHELPATDETIVVGASERCSLSVLGLCLGSEPTGGEERNVYSERQLEALLPEPGAVGFLLDGFDRDGDSRISRDELARAAGFMGLDLAQLRSLQDWYLRYDLMSQPGVAEVASVGGFVRQYQVEADPEKLRAFGISLAHVTRALERANLDAGGRLIEMAETEYMVRGHGYVRSLDDLETIPVGIDSERHVPILLSQVARVQIGPDARRGLVDMNGEGEVVGGIVLMRFGATRSR